MIPVKLSGGLSGWKYVEGDWPDEKRCTYIRPNGKRKGERCKCARRNGYELCSWHIRWVARINRPKFEQYKQRLAKVKASMPKFYGKYVTKTLAEMLDKCLEINPKDQLQLFEELALIRDVAGQSVALYSAAKQLADDNPLDSKKRDLLLQAGEVMKMQIAEVVKTCEAASRVANAAQDRVSIHQLHFFVDQVSRCAYESFGDDPRAELFRQKMLTQVRLPVDGSSTGTHVTPDMDVMGMDDTIPKVYEEVIDLESNGISDDNGRNGQRSA